MGNPEKPGGATFDPGRRDRLAEVFRGYMGSKTGFVRKTYIGKTGVFLVCGDIILFRSWEKNI